MNQHTGNTSDSIKGKRVLFTEDEWTTTFEGVVYLETLYSYYIISRKYGNTWVPKSNVKLKNDENIRH